MTLIQLALVLEAGRKQAARHGHDELHDVLDAMVGKATRLAHATETGSLAQGVAAAAEIKMLAKRYL